MRVCKKRTSLCLGGSQGPCGAWESRSSWHRAAPAKLPGTRRDFGCKSSRGGGEVGGEQLCTTPSVKNSEEHSGVE